MIKEDTLEKSCPLNRIEQTLLNLDKISCVNFIVIARVSGTVTQEHIQEALLKMQEYHPVLKASVHTDPVPHFVFHQHLPVPFEHIEGEGEEAWLPIAEEELSKPVDYKKGPLMRLTHVHTLRHDDLIFCFDHLYADGISGVEFVKDFLEIYNSPNYRIHFAHNDEGKTKYLDLSNFPDSVFGFSGLIKMISIVFSMVRKNLSPRKGRIPRENPRIPVDERKSFILHRELNAEQSEKIFSFCKQHAITVQGALCSALSKTFADLVSCKTNIFKPKIDCISVVNMRTHFKTKPDRKEMGLFVGQVVHPMIRRENHKFLEFASGIGKGIRTYFKNGNLFVVYRLMFSQKFKTADAFMKVFEVRDPYIEVSNLGRVEFSKDKKRMELQNIHFASSQHFFQATRWGLNLFVLTHENKMIMNFQMLSSAWTREECNRVVDDSLAYLLDSCLAHA